MNLNDLDYELIRLVWSGRFQIYIIYVSKSGNTHVEEIRWKWFRSDHESDLKVTICLICLQFVIFYLFNQARIDIRLIRSNRVDLGWPRVWSQSTRMVERVQRCIMYASTTSGTYSSTFGIVQPKFYSKSGEVTLFAYALVLFLCSIEN
jgi:hypothetical protein